jgi:hypothetical protein
MSPMTLEFLTEQVALSDQLMEGRDRMLEPQDLPGRYGRVVKAIDHLLEVIRCEAVLAGGWAVWRHGFTARLTQDIDIVLPADRIEEFLRVAAVSGFVALPQPPGRWPKVQHKESNVKVDILPEGARPGTSGNPAPTTIPPPGKLGATGTRLQYIGLPWLIELKLAAGRARDEADVVALIRANPEQVSLMRQHVAGVHADYAAAFDRLVQRSREEEER